MKDKEDVKQVFDACALEYQNIYMDVSPYKNSFDAFCLPLAGKEVSIFEIGCGPGNVTQVLYQLLPDARIFCVDFAPEMIKLAKINNPKAEFEVMDFRNIAHIKDTFQAVMAGFCLPYLSKEETQKFITDASGLLEEGGLLYISTMEDAYSNSGLKKSSSGDYDLFMYFHEQEYLIEFLETSGFELIFNHTFVDPKGVKDLVLIGKKK